MWSGDSEVPHLLQHTKLSTGRATRAFFVWNPLNCTQTPLPFSFYVGTASKMTCGMKSTIWAPEGQLSPLVTCYVWKWVSKYWCLFWGVQLWQKHQVCTYLVVSTLLSISSSCDCILWLRFVSLNLRFSEITNQKGKPHFFSPGLLSYSCVELLWIAAFQLTNQGCHW